MKRNAGTHPTTNGTRQAGGGGNKGKGMCGGVWHAWEKVPKINGMVGCGAKGRTDTHTHRQAAQRWGGGVYHTKKGNTIRGNNMSHIQKNGWGKKERKHMCAGPWGRVGRCAM